MLSSRHVRIAFAAAASLVLAAALRVLLIYAASADASADLDTRIADAFAAILTYALPLVALAIAASERMKLRHAGAHVAIGLTIAFVAGWIETWGTPFTAPLYTDAGLMAVSVAATGATGGLVYWLLSGRRAGWMGDAAEQAQASAAEAFKAASIHHEADYCVRCAAAWTIAGLVLLALLGWIATSASGLRDGLLYDVQARAGDVLKASGFGWARFEIAGSRGVLTGTAPDEAQLHAADARLRTAMSAVTGFPGILRQLDNRATSQLAMSAVSQQMAQAERREAEAKVAAQAARMAEDAARAAEAEALRRNEQREQAAQSESAMNAEQALALQSELKRKAEEEVAAAQAEIKRTAEEQMQAVQAEMKRQAEAQAAEEEARRRAEAAAAEAAAAQAEKERQMAALELEAQAAAQAAPEAQARVNSPGDGTPAAGPCAPQDLAIIESSRILFDKQLFELSPGYDTELDRLAASAKACAPRPILISGHADADADSLFNRSLGLQRAQRVGTQLAARGVPATLIIAESAGTENIAMTDGPAEARAFNRRVEFKLLDAAAISRDAKLDPEERANTCETDLSGIMAQSIIRFRTASSRISDDSFGLIKRLARAIETCGSVIVTVEGHTDKIGDATYNQSLSEARANAVREALVINGADPTRLASKGFAASQPYDPTDTAEAFALNRRIEFKVSGKFKATATGGP